MLKSANSCYSLEIDKLRQAYIYVANILYSKRVHASKKPNLQSLQNQTTLWLMQIMIAQIYKSKMPDSPDLSSFVATLDELQSIDTDEFFNVNPEFLKLSTSNVEDIGINYDILQNYKLKIDNSKLVIVNCSKLKKKQGSFYTPIHIVDFIIDKTLGKRLAELSRLNESAENLFDSLLKLRILDPSVGGGIFLIRAVRYIKTWIRSKYPDIENETFNNLIDRFITDCLFGFDVNKTACYLTKMSLQLLLQKPPIDNDQLNISCTNSLDLISNNSKPTKFDIIISNPPFQFGENIPKLRKNTSAKYELAAGQFDIYWLFYELAIKKLLKNDGYHGYIIPDSLMTRDETEPLRQKLLEKSITEIWHIGAAFNSLHVSTIILIWQNRKPGKSSKINVTDKAQKTWQIKQSAFNKNGKSRFLIYLATEKHSKIISKMTDNQVSVGDLFKIHRGEEIGKKALVSKGDTEHGILCGDSILPYRILEPSLYLRNVSTIRKPQLTTGNHVLLRKTGSTIVAAYDPDKHMFLQSVYCLKLIEKLPQTQENSVYMALLGFLNSRLINFYVRNTFTAYKLVYPQLNQSTIAEIPLPANFLAADWSELTALVEKLMKNSVNNPESLQADVDAIVYSAYNLSDNEIELVNKHQTSLSFKR